MIFKIVCLFLILFALGYFLSAYLYKKQGKAFRGSTLHVKVLLWIPIFVVFVVFVYSPRYVQALICLGVTAMMFRECGKRIALSSHSILIYTYTIITALAFLHLLLFPQGELETSELLITIGFASVLSDVAAFFIGNFFGKHPLPRQFNALKSWEGVWGQIIGAIIGVVLVRLTLFNDTSWWLALPIGIGAALGDLFNSYVKRKEGIKDWSFALPGHGGYLDRFASLSGSTILTYYVVLVMR